MADRRLRPQLQDMLSAKSLTYARQMRSSIVPGRRKRHVASVMHINVSNVYGANSSVKLLEYVSLALNSRPLSQCA
jgi:hypothetical protein